MLAIRMQRTGRKGHAMFRMVVQEARLHPTSGRVVAHLGHYDPHSKDLKLDKEKAATYLKNGAQPSERITLLFKKEGIKLPSWVEAPQKKSGEIRNPEKLRKNRPAEESVEAAEPAEASQEESAAEVNTEAETKEADIEEPKAEEAKK